MVSTDDELKLVLLQKNVYKPPSIIYNINIYMILAIYCISLYIADHSTITKTSFILMNGKYCTLDPATRKTILPKYTV